MATPLLILNAGSSSLKFAVYEVRGKSLTRRECGSVNRIGQSNAEWIATSESGEKAQPRRAAARTHGAAVKLILRHLGGNTALELAGIGHRIVHGGPTFTQPQTVTMPLLAALEKLRRFDPEHLPAEIALIRDMRRRFPRTPQVACFDTNFHRDLPPVAQALPIPRRYTDAGIRRYGFHGLSYEFLLGELWRLKDPAATKGRVILAHLGNGASLAAVRDGRPIDTSMGFTPTAGLVMGTRTGDLDPGLMTYLAQAEKMSAARFNHLVNHESGLLGVSGTSGDMRTLRDREGHDPRAALAIALFCYQAKKWIGSFAAALGGLDTLVFSGGIGEHDPAVRARICAGLGFLGLNLSAWRNTANAGVISTPGSDVVVRVIATDEERVIAQHTRNLIFASRQPGGKRAPAL